jgi:Rrf2 family transcriptional regulator, iron-sulfur cluster assembly transcription factor
MRITTKGRYALRAVLALAQSSSGGKPVSIKTIAEQEDISAEFLEQIFFKLRKAEVIRSVRGPGGAFFFARPLDQITLLDIIEASGEGMGISPCVCGKKESCNRKSECASFDIWRAMDGHIRAFAGGRTVADMMMSSATSAH